jgi:putative nucleotidyltransferase with HDIG domain
MIEGFAKLKRQFNRILRILLVIASTATILFCFPSNGSFKYEFHKGNPWKHETLIAPFDFAIHKTEKEIASERIELLKNYKPYFIHNDTIGNMQTKAFKYHFLGEWDMFIKLSHTKKDSSFLARQKNVSLQICTSIFKQIYNNGIIKKNAEYQQTKEISIINNRVSEITNIETVFTPISAYNFFINTSSEKIKSKSIQHFVKNLNINSFLYPNLFFDKEKSEQYKNQIIQNISLSKGVVQYGERIVMKGDIVDESKFQILSSLKLEYEKFLGTSGKRQLTLIGRALIILSCLIVFMLFLLNFRIRIFYNNKKMLFIFLAISLISILASIVTQLPYLNIYLVPVLLVPIIINAFTDPKTALASLVTSALIMGYIVPNSYEFVFMHITAGCIAIYSLNKLHRRGQLILTTILVFITYILVYTAFSFTQETELQNIDWYKLAWFAGNCFLLTLSYPLIYMFEKMFGFISDTTLIELSNPNHPILRQLTLKAPGTFQHSLQVANLAEEAIYKIGGNPLLVRAGALYHDIGKMYNPLFFIENQAQGSLSPHSNLEFNESAKIITDHVKMGVKLARKHNLPDQIIHFIVTHHGEGKAIFFYNSFKNKYPDQEIIEEDFTYPGPNPFSKETAVLMMADAVEASCRSLKEKSSETISQLIDEVIDKQIKEGKFNSADITFKDIDTIKKTFIQMEININHGRIAYPKSDKE